MKAKRIKSLSTLRNVAKLSMDELIIRKSDLVAQERGFEEDEKRLLEQLSKEEVCRIDDIHWYRTFSKFKEGIDIKVRTIRYARSILQVEIDKLSEEILELHIEQKKYDKLTELSEKRSKEDAKAKEQKELDVVGSK